MFFKCTTIYHKKNEVVAIAHMCSRYGFNGELAANLINTSRICTSCREKIPFIVIHLLLKEFHELKKSIKLVENHAVEERFYYHSKYTKCVL